MGAPAAATKRRSTFSRLTKDPHLPLGMVLLMHADSLEPFGLIDPLEQRLGIGSFGAAYATEVGKSKSVLKFTRDPTEAQTAAALLGKKTDRIVPVYGVWAIPGTRENEMRPWYLVHRGYLAPLSKKDARLMDILFDLYADKTLDLSLPRKNSTAMRDKWRTYIFGATENQKNEDDARHVDVQRAMILLAHVAEAVHEMHRYGVDWADIHGSNMMRDARGRLVIGDIGWGYMHNDTEADINYLSPEIVEKHLAIWGK